MNRTPRRPARCLASGMFVVLTACGSSEAATQSAVPPPSAPASTEITLHIEGMACDACASRVEKELREIDGVQRATVDFATSRARVVFDPARVDAERIDETVDALGFASRIEPTS